MRNPFRYFTTSPEIIRLAVMMYVRFPPDVIRYAVWLYFRFLLSYRDVEDLFAKREFNASYETVRHWALKFGQAYAQKLRNTRPPNDGSCVCEGDQEFCRVPWQPNIRRT